MEVVFGFVDDVLDLLAVCADDGEVGEWSFDVVEFAEGDWVVLAVDELVVGGYVEGDHHGSGEAE